MKHIPRLNLQKGDFLAVALVVVIAVLTALAYLPAGSSAETVQVFQDGRLIREMSLSADQSITVHGQYANEITIKDGKAAITASDCPGEDCVHSGWIQAAGRSIACLPNRVEIRITGASDVDFVVG